MVVQPDIGVCLIHSEQLRTTGQRCEWNTVRERIHEVFVSLREIRSVVEIL